MNLKDEFQKYAHGHRGISSLNLPRYQTATNSYITPNIIEERQLNIASKAQLEHDDYEKFIYMIKTAEWVDDRKIDRIAFNFDGYIDLGYRVYFSLEQKILLYENYFCGLREEIYLMLKGNEIKK